jgi:molybdopterin-binding protein
MRRIATKVSARIVFTVTVARIVKGVVNAEVA